MTARRSFVRDLTRRARRLPRPSAVLATLGAVVATATGMFTLRDQLFAHEPVPGGTPPTVMTSASDELEAEYRDAVARTCARLEADERDNATRFRRFKEQLSDVRTGYDERDGLLSIVDSAAARSRRALSVFEGLEVHPSPLEPIARRVVRRWRENAGRLQAYAENLRQAESFGDLVQAVSRHNDRRARDRTDAAAVLKGLVEIAGERCESPPPITVVPLQLLGSGASAEPAPTEPEPGLPPAVARTSLAQHVEPDAPLPEPVSAPPVPHTPADAPGSSQP
jgi:hypothetical protein